ncbi:hypothetical protein OUZ56_024710 [Daphnia magna]|uniref:Uncharacterized protein n=1 Tax=Daphnia magna TaxID=35525 RepID=A0ABQ9ZHT0_9CRUS|nr:hypothetical protein OUZ56_024710 [Daphnia magna]
MNARQPERNFFPELTSYLSSHPSHHILQNLTLKWIVPVSESASTKFGGLFGQFSLFRTSQILTVDGFGQISGVPNSSQVDDYEVIYIRHD